MKQVVLSLLFCSLLLFTSCFQIIEEIFLNKNGSGTMQVTVDMDEMMGMFSAFMPDSLKGDMNFEEMIGNGESDEEIAKIEAIKGISNVQMKHKGEYSFSLSYDFANIDALNNAMEQNALQKDGGLASAFLKGFGNEYEIKKRYIHRTFEIKDLPLGEEEEDSNPFKELGSLGDLMKSPTYQFIYHVPKKFKKVVVKDRFAKMEETKKELKFTYNLFEIMSEKGKVIDHELKFK